MKAPLFQSKLIMGSLLLLFFLIQACAGQNNGLSEIYVAKNGDDSNPGSYELPYLTLAKAASVAGPGDVCYIREGIYEEILEPVNSGTEDKPIIFRSFEGEEVVISALETLGSWTRDKGEVFKIQVDWDLGQENFIIAEGVICDLARWPDNEDKLPFTLNSLRNSGGSDKEVKKDAFLDYEQGLPDFPWQEGGSIFFFGDAKGSGWLAWRKYISGSQKNRVYFDLPSSWVGSYHAPADSGDFYLQGIREVLDFPYEWYLDENGTLYLQLPEGKNPGENKVMMRKRKGTINLNGKSHIHIRDLAVIGGSIEMGQSASHNVLSGISSYYGNHTAGIMDGYISGSQSILVRGNNNQILQCEIAYGAGTGIYISGKGNHLENCLIHDFNTLGSYDAPVIMRKGSNTSVKHNTIYNAGRDGIQMFHRNSEIAYNDVSRTNLIAHDCGPIYTLGGPFNSEIHHNWFHDVYCRGKLYKGTGIYLDNSSVGFSVHHNVLWNTEWTSIQINLNATDIEVYNNTFWNGSETMGWWRPKVGEFPRLKEDTKFENVKVYNNLSNEGTWDPQTLRENNMVFESDPFVNSAEGDFRLKTDPGRDVGAYSYGGEDWRAGIDWDPIEGPAGHGNYGLIKSIPDIQP